TVYGLVNNAWWSPVAEPGRCSDENYGWVNAITLVTSSDAGAHFSHPADYKIRVPPTPWSSNFPCSESSPTIYGSFGPTNIIKKDAYYYSFFLSHPDPLGLSNEGVCLMRTDNLASASSWKVWTGQDWQSSRTTPRCGPLANLIDTSSVTYNFYLGAYVALSMISAGNPDYGGIHYSLSQDLINWSPRVRFVRLTSQDPLIAYVSLLDPTDTGRNFEVTGREPYLYYVEWQGGSGEAGNQNRHIERKKIRFTDLSPTPACTPNWSCSAWNQCSVSGSQSRTCTDTNNCSSATGKPVENQTCTVPQASCTVGSVTLQSGQSSTFYAAPSVQSPALCSATAQTRTCTNGSMSGPTSLQYSTCEQTAPTTSMPQQSCTQDGETLASGSNQTFYSSRTVPFGSLCSSISQVRTCTNGVLSGIHPYASCAVAAPPTAGGSSTAGGGSSSAGTQSTGTSVSSSGSIGSGSPPIGVTTAPSPAATLISSQLTEQKVAALLAQIQQLQALIAKLKGSSAATPPPISNSVCPSIIRNLSRGMRGTDVTQLQQFLYKTYENFPQPTGYFGALTEGALQQWQKEHNIVSSGSPSTTGYGAVGPKTRAALARCT
ncbi:peptidoglycan-binding protein, partial [Candidatus Uhrbacteria bacterium]|nr:peptidoglycan-binding protein [Candidatus Uhrbacteria bacterium]